MRWLRRQPPPGGRLPSLGQDFAEGHRRYVERLGAERELWLRTKPFSVAPSHELFECFRFFAHAVERLGLGLRAQVLDVGCGPGWLSEFLARCGYWVTGVDVSEQMVSIARQRVAAIQDPIGPGMHAVAEFHAMPVLELPWRRRFDAVVLYDAMHHFDDEVETLRTIRGTLAPGGQILIHEGVRPEPGSEGEQTLIAEMEEFGTLESPFDPDYLVAVVDEAGFAEVRRFAAFDDLLDVSKPEEELERVGERLGNPPMNTVLAVNPGRVDEAFAARIEPGEWRSAGDQLLLPLRVTNDGARYWPDGADHGFPIGSVAVGAYVPGDVERMEIPRQALPRAVARGEQVEVELRLPRVGHRELVVDLVREGIAWFADYGSPPIVIRPPQD